MVWRTVCHTLFGTEAEAFKENRMNLQISEPKDLREARAKLAELRVDYAEENPRIQEALARIKNLEQSNGGITVSTLNEQPPVVVETFPASGAYDVAPGETEIRVRFSKEMANDSWIWSATAENSTPEFIGKPHYEADARTCVAKVKLEPGRTYAFWLNSEKISQLQGQRRPSGDPVFADFPNETKNKKDRSP